jgi:septal ring factor EnvC (AmiA/AmiB activator)
MTETAGGAGGLKSRISARGEEALGDLADSLLENPVFNQALQAAFGARDAAAQATQQALKNLNLPSAGDVERVGRRLRSVSDRLEDLEDRLDQVGRDVAAIRKRIDEAAAEAERVDGGRR